MNLHTLLAALAVAVVVWALTVAVLFVFGKPRAARELIVLVPNLLRLFKGLLGDPRVPRSAKVALAIGAVWIASPIDLIPEFIPVLGPLDDAIVAAVILRYLVRRTGRDVIHEHWNGNPETIDRVLGLLSRTSVPRAPEPDGRLSSHRSEARPSVGTVATTTTAGRDEPPLRP